MEIISLESNPKGTRTGEGAWGKSPRCHHLHACQETLLEENKKEKLLERLGRHSRLAPAAEFAANSQQATWEHGLSAEHREAGVPSNRR